MKKIPVMFLCAVMLFAGCAANKEVLKDGKPNEVQLAIEEAKAAIAEARKAGAEKYAKELLDSAVSKLTVAEEAAKKADNEVALNFAKKSTVDAKLARDKALAATMLEKAEAEIKAAALAGAENLAAELYAQAGKDFLAGQKLNAEKDYTGAFESAKKAYEAAAEARRLCELIKKAEDMIALAKEDIAEAEKAGAKRLAPELFKSAQDNLAIALTAFVEKDFIKAIDYAGKASDDAKAAKSACIAANAGKYTVKRGDNLWNISKDSKVFDNPFLWPLLYKSNRDRIKDPDWIYPNQQFELPAEADEMQKKNAIGDAFKYKGK